MAEHDGDYKVTIPNNVHRAVRHLPFVVAHCAQLAQYAQSICGPGWQVIVQNDPATRRPRAYFFTDNPEAIRRDAQENTVMRAISALRSYNPNQAPNSAVRSMMGKFETTARQIVGGLTGSPNDGGNDDRG